MYIIKNFMCYQLNCLRVLLYYYVDIDVIVINHVHTYTGWIKIKNSGIL